MKNNQEKTKKELVKALMGSRAISLYNSEARMMRYPKEHLEDLYQTGVKLGAKLGGIDE